jgi:hypothetical protein
VLLFAVRLASCREVNFAEPLVTDSFQFMGIVGTLMNSRSMITNETANALRAAMKIGVQVIIATGKVCSLCVPGNHKILMQLL